MTDSMNVDVRLAANPFSTCFVQPGAIVYRRYDGGTLEGLVDEFWERHGGMAAIIGPHGSGKSTLLASLKPYLEKRSKVFSYRMNAEDRHPSAIWNALLSAVANDVLVVDGYEQLSPWNRWRLRRVVRKRGVKLLVTAHRRSAGLPVLWETGIDEALATRLRDDLLASWPDLRFASDLESAWQDARHRFPTDLRETLMSMYDWVESKREKAKTARQS